MNKTLTAADKRHMGKVIALGCLNHDGTPAEGHHATIATPRNNCLIIPLCFECHRGEFSIHKSKREFEAVYGDEISMLAETNRRLA